MGEHPMDVARRAISLIEAKDRLIQTLRARVKELEDRLAAYE